MTPNVETIIADYLDPDHATALGSLLDSYAADPMGGGAPLDEFIKKNLATELSKIPHAFSILCFVDGDPAGLANCFEAFSTFKCKPLINIHDLAVTPNYRGQGLSQKMLARIEDIARQRGCCKITLEVLAGNTLARSAYERFGFTDYQLDPTMGSAIFWEKELE